MPKKGALTHECIIEGAKLFKDKLIKDYGFGNRVAYLSDEVWNDLSKYFDYKMSSAALHIFIKSNRANILETLGLYKQEETKKNVHNLSPDNTLSSSSYYTSDDNDNKLPIKKIIMTLSPEEWETIKPKNSVYKINKSVRMYMTLPKGEWSHIIAEHFWELTHLQCCLTFKRAKVYPAGQFYVQIFGRCKICKSNFKGVINHEPSSNSRVLIDCSYVGNFNIPHDTPKKRRMTTGIKKQIINDLINKGKSSEYFREEEAVRLMKKGQLEPSILPSANALRVAKSKELKLRQRHSDSLTAILLMKLEKTYTDCIHDIGLDPFFIHFYTPELIHLYRAYTKSASYPSLIIDATGTVIKKFSKLGLIKTQTLYLYEAVIYDDDRNHTFTACSMISERHDNIAIYNWLSRWLKSGIPPPKETCCDMSLALLSALVRSFTQYSSLNDYINICSLLILENNSGHSFWLPKCFIRIDVSHFVKNLTKWSPFKTVSKRVKEIYLRVICLIVKSQSISEIKSLLLSIFVVASNETSGGNVETGIETPCSKHKKILIEAASDGIINSIKEFQDIILDTENLDNSTINYDIIQQDDDVLNGLEDSANPFNSWVDSIHTDSNNYKEEGNDLNPLYLPSVIPLIKKEIKMLPLWSGIMIPIFGYGSVTKSSAAVESTFHKLKNVIFKDIDLPTTLETFIERRLTSLKGSALLYDNDIEKCTSTISEDPIYNSDNYPMVNSVHSCPKPVYDKCDYSFHQIDNDTIEVCNNLVILPKNKEIINNEEDYNLHKGNSDKSSTYKQTIDDSEGSNSNQSLNSEYFFQNNTFISRNDELCIREQTINLKKSSSDEQDHGQFTIHHQKHLIDKNDEDTATEKWKRKNQRQTKSYLTPNSHLKHLNLNIKNNKKVLPLLKNGSRAEDLKALNIKGYGRIILTNTCAFDTAVSLFMAAMCDSDKYLKCIDQFPGNSFITFTKTVLSTGISIDTYRKRAKIIIETQDPVQTPLKYDQIMYKCDTTFGNLLSCIIPEHPTIYDQTICNTCTEKYNQYCQTSYIYNGNFENLVECINERLQKTLNTCHNNIDNKKCENIKTITPSLSDKHIFIDVLHNDEGSDGPTSRYIKLSEIPLALTIQNTTYELRGVCSFTGGNLSEVGHYTAYCKRSNGSWELYDDLAIKAIPKKNGTLVKCECLYYTI